MYVVINGGGKVGSYLAHNLIKKGHGVAVIEKRSEVLEKLAGELPTKVLLIEGDGCGVKYQEDAGVGHADIFAAVTGNDDDNLVSCQLARAHFGVKRTVARINSPRNEHIFHALGIEGISSTTIISQLIEEEATISEIIHLHTLKKGQISLVEINLPNEDRLVCSRKVHELNLPEGSVLVALVRGDKVIVPKGDTVMERGDQVLAVTVLGKEEELRRILQGK
jgi:trk system potassium uptake protein TrkA